MNARLPNKTLEHQYQQQGSQCFWCSQPVSFEIITREHFYPKVDGHTLVNNKIFACGFCNKFKGHKSIDELHYATIASMQKILSMVVFQSWNITPRQLKKFRKLHAVMKTTNHLRKNNYQPEKLFS